MYKIKITEINNLTMQCKYIIFMNISSMKRVKTSEIIGNGTQWKDIQFT